MSKTAVSAILDKALSTCFDHHIELSPPPVTPKNAEFCAAERKFIESLSEEQTVAYQKMGDLLSNIEADEWEHYYRIGFKDGLAAWRGA